MTEVRDIEEFVQEDQEGFYSKKILVEGDSWVSHFLLNVTNIATQVDKMKSHDYLILNLADPGDEASSIFKAHGKQMKRLKRLLHTEQWGDTFDLILLSAAGNDIVGPEIVSKGYVKNKKDCPNLYGKELVTDNFYNMVSDVVKGYGRFLKLRDTSSLNESTPVITHVYSYLEPREVGTHIGELMFHKGWIKRHLKHQGVVDRDEQYEIVVEMLDSFHRRLMRICDQYANFLVVDTRELLMKNGAPNLDWWFDEIHPNVKGFRKIAKHIRKEAIAKGMWNL